MRFEKVGTLLARGGADGPYRVAFAPLAGTERPLRWKEAATLDEVFDHLGVDPGTRRLADADLVRTGAASVTGLRAKPRVLRKFWPGQF